MFISLLNTLLRIWIPTTNRLLYLLHICTYANLIVYFLLSSLSSPGCFDCLHPNRYSSASQSRSVYIFMIVNILGFLFLPCYLEQPFQGIFLSIYLSFFYDYRSAYSCSFEPETSSDPTKEAEYYGLGHFYICDFHILLISLPTSVEFWSLFFTFSGRLGVA